MKSLLWLLLPLSLAACESEEEPKPQDLASALAAGNTMDCTVDGQAFKARGKQVRVGGFGIANEVLSLGIGLYLDRDGHTYSLDSSLMALPLRVGTYHFPPLDKPGLSFAGYQIRDSKQNLVESYEGGIYGMHFSPVENDPQAKVKLEVDKLGVTKASMPGFKRVDLSGRLAYNAAALPEGKTSEACTTEALQRSLPGRGRQRSLPMFNAKICGTKKVHVQCSFKIAGEFMAQ